MLFDTSAHGAWPFNVSDVAMSRWAAETAQDQLTARFAADSQLALHYVQPYDLGSANWYSLAGELGAALFGTDIGTGLRVRYRSPIGWNANDVSEYVSALLGEDGVLVGSEFGTVADIVIEGLIVPIATDVAAAAQTGKEAAAETSSNIPWITVGLIAIFAIMLLGRLAR